MKDPESHERRDRMTPASPKKSILWLFTGGMALILAVACGSILSGAATAVSARMGIREETIVAIAVTILLVGFLVALVAGLRDLAALVRRDERSLPRRWVVGSCVALFVAGPFWNLCVVQFQEPISGSDSVRIHFDNVLYVLNLTLMLPLGVGVPLILTRLRRQARRGRPSLTPS